ncbi:S-(hydroxymethyl)glutathione dehydrogenase / alcohol dehydrogenase [Kytococcus aerolatus]|uniref:S-(Hydroxymethyl)glutathione dehydrogenase / alcohol dehydrogenase n=1 Tax=Kytococcus aerolatus TaxID=592308 RepID=A0A212U6G6_9MICO|nr:zinc-binding dehydrogenase [Kytococcus aerolatus]SNC73855.1 S-(hydroxymethyl)glutathione dehydrogenase / alcohol dehydrogenase [Kytococcus aerolatus]
MSAQPSPTVPATMRAAVWEGGSPSLRVEEIPVPEPKEGEALVRVAACGVCHTDLHVLKGEVAFPGPAVVGHEISGTIAATGPGVEGLAVGDRVVGAFIMPCGRCRHCERDRDDMCETFFAENRLKGNLLDGTTRLARPDGSRLSMYSMGGMAEYAVVPVTALTGLPEGLPLDRSCVLGCAGFTAYGALAASGLVAGESMAVVAVGGVGSSLVQLGRHLGADPVVAVDVSDEKLEGARGLGATATVNSTTQDAVAAVREAVPGGVDVVFEALGRPETFELSQALLTDGGRMVAVGIAAGDATARVPITQLVRRGHTIRGSFGARTRQDLPRVVELAAEGGFDVQGAVTRTYALEEADAAYRDLAAGRITGRAIVVMPGAD